MFQASLSSERQSIEILETSMLQVEGSQMEIILGCSPDQGEQRLHCRDLPLQAAAQIEDENGPQFRKGFDQ